MSSTHHLQAIKGKPSNEAGARRDVRPLAAPVSEHDRWMELQRGIGNQAVSRVLQRRARGGAEIGSTRRATTQSAGSNLILQRKCACGAGAAGPQGECEECSKRKIGLQTKLRINEPGDVYEQEADRIAEHVMQKPAQAGRTPAPPRIQRITGEPANQTDAAPATVERTLASPGIPLHPTLRQEMEQRFGHDFSRVRVHSGAAADRSTREVSANAYTVGNNIVFGAGQFAPESHEGRRLIAHELTHVVQQSTHPLRLLRQHSGKKQSGSYEVVENVWKSLLRFSARARAKLSSVGTQMTDYLKEYDDAYGSFSKTLAKAKEEADESAKWMNVMIGLVVGTGVGVIAGELYAATTLIKAIAYEFAGEVVEAIIAGGASISTPDFTPPAGLNNDKLARRYLEQLVKAYQSIENLQDAKDAFSDRRDQLGAAAQGGAKALSLDDMDKLEKLSSALNSAEKVLTEFVTRVDTPLLRRDTRTIEQDIWIAWMVDNYTEAVKPPTLPRAYVFGAAPDIASSFPYVFGAAGYLIREIPDIPLQAEAIPGEIGKRLSEIGVFRRLYRVGEAGYYPTDIERAQEEQARIEQIGFVGVVIIPPRFESHSGKAWPGVIRFRHDAYTAGGRAAPRPDPYVRLPRAERYAQITWQAPALKPAGEPPIRTVTRHGYVVTEYLKPGYVVMVRSTTPDGLVVDRIVDTVLAVTEDERASALQLLEGSPPVRGAPLP